MPFLIETGPPRERCIDLRAGKLTHPAACGILKMEIMVRGKSRLLYAAFLFCSILVILNHPANGQANVSRSPGLHSTSPRIAIDSVGNLHVVWAEYYSTTSGDCFYSKYDVGGKTWSIPINLSHNGLVCSPEDRACGIDVDGVDNIYVIYVEKNSLSMRVFSSGTWGAPFQVHSWSDGDCDGARVAVTLDGDVFTSWWVTSTDRVYSRARVWGNWEPVVQISQAAPARFSDIAVGGNAVFAVWTRKDTFYRIYYARRNATSGASWSPPQIVRADSVNQGEPAVEVDDTSIAHIVYAIAAAKGGIGEVCYTRWTGTGFTSTVKISSTLLLHNPSLHSRGSNLYCCWQEGASGDGTGVFYNNKIAGAWQGIGFAPDSAGCTYADLSVNPSQSEIDFVWDSGGEIWCNMGAIAGPPPAGDNEPPTADFAFTPSSGIYPVEITFDASASLDPDGSIIQYSWNFGDGGRASGQVIKHTYNLWGTFSVSLTVQDDQGATANKIRNIEIRRLFQPLAISWTAHKDESLFLIRYVNRVTWTRNPANDDLGIRILLHRIWRKKAAESADAYRLIGEVSGNSYAYLDTDTGAKDTYVYTVTVRDDQGHESPIVGDAGNATLLRPARNSPPLPRRGKLPVR